MGGPTLFSFSIVYIINEYYQINEKEIITYGN